MSHINQLIAMYDEWCKANGLPDNLSADELILNDDITGDQHTWLTTFIDFWQQVQKSDL